MEPILELLKQRESVDDRSHDYEYQELGDEMYRHFGKGSGRKVYPLFSSFKYTHRQLRDAWETYKKTGKHSFDYFMGVLKNTK